MQKTLYIHIGAHKTGTSALQYFFSQNRNVLEQNDYHYAGQKRACHDFSNELKTKTFSEIISNEDSTSQKYVNEIKQTSCKNIILCSEGFITLKENEVATLRKIFPDGYRIKIIIYLRRQDERLELSYNQCVKGVKTRWQQKFSDCLPHMLESGAFDYYSVLLPWSRIFEKENIIVRVFEPEQLPDGIYRDFLKVAGLPSDANYCFPTERINPRLNWDLIEIIRICNIRFNDDSRFHRFLINNFKQINQGMKGVQQHLLSPKQRRDIIARFEESNAMIAREYLGRTDGRLFHAPLPDLCEPWEPCQGLTVEKIVPVFTQMLFNLHTQRKKSEKRSLKRRMMSIIKKMGTKVGLPGMENWYAWLHRS
jgi:hypothetical protein